jgi:hypothetical protein
MFELDSEHNGEEMSRFGVDFKFWGFGTVMECFGRVLKLVE